MQIILDSFHSSVFCPQDICAGEQESPGGERAYRLINSMKKDITSMMREKE
jgi:hypothetical protein